MGARVRIEQQLVGVKAVAGLRFEWAVHTETIERRWANVGEVAVEYFISKLGKLESIDLAPVVGIEQTNVHACGVSRKNREVRAFCVRRRP